MADQEQQEPTQKPDDVVGKVVPTAATGPVAAVEPRVLRARVIEREAAEPTLIAVTEEHSMSGPLPDPDALAAYDQAVPGLARQIVDAYLEDQRAYAREQEHRHAMEREQMNIARTQVEGSLTNVRRGQWFGFGCVLVFGTLSAFAMWRGEYGWGTALVGGVLTGLVTVFVTGTRARDTKTDRGDSSDQPNDTSDDDATEN